MLNRRACYVVCLQCTWLLPESTRVGAFDNQRLTHCLPAVHMGHVTRLLPLWHLGCVVTAAVHPLWRLASCSAHGRCLWDPLWHLGCVVAAAGHPLRRLACLQCTCLTPSSPKRWRHQAQTRERTLKAAPLVAPCLTRCTATPHVSHTLTLSPLTACTPKSIRIPSTSDAGSSWPVMRPKVVHGPCSGRGAEPASQTEQPSQSTRHTTKTNAIPAQGVLVG